MIVILGDVILKNLTRQVNQILRGVTLSCELAEQPKGSE